MNNILEQNENEIEQWRKEFIALQNEARKAKEAKQPYSNDVLEIDARALDKEALQLWWLIKNIKTTEEYEMVKMRFVSYRSKTQNDLIKRKQYESFTSYMGNYLTVVHLELERKQST